MLIPLPASVSRGDQLENAKAYAGRATCVVVDDEEMADGTPLLRACEQLLPALGGARRCPDPEAVRRTARDIATRTIALARPRGRHAR
ncbi:hypothetical protein ABZW03_05105 [Kitasatospora sp. NPDC004799]|uniref:hypothetical protein n=1 Tax=Kitasatospora sp. NPDC004799 TaxID=3154460 RepID=UPI0033B3A909